MVQRLAGQFVILVLVDSTTPSVQSTPPTYFNLKITFPRAAGGATVVIMVRPSMSFAVSLLVLLGAQGAIEGASGGKSTTDGEREVHKHPTQQ